MRAMPSPAARCARCEGAGCDSCGGTGLHVASRVAAELAEQLAFKLNHPTWFADGVRCSFDKYAALVGEENLTDEVRKARQI